MVLDSTVQSQKSHLNNRRIFLNCTNKDDFFQKLILLHITVIVFSFFIYHLSYFNVKEIVNTDVSMIQGTS